MRSYEDKPKNEPLEYEILHPEKHEEEQYNTHEVLEESLSIADNEKELIIKALDKHNNRRKKAAEELGISERTLYRKIKEYDIP
jgi:transcriptional regulator with PAS, ATPase and Fis domain